MFGKTEIGKSICVETIIMLDNEAGRRCCLLDPHGDLVEKVVKAIPQNRKKNLIYFNITDPKLNPRY